MLHKQTKLKSFRRICFEVFLFSCFILTIPLAILFTEILFMYGTRFIQPDVLQALWEDTQNVSAIG